MYSTVLNRWFIARFLRQHFLPTTCVRDALEQKHRRGHPINSFDSHPLVSRLVVYYADERFFAESDARFASLVFAFIGTLAEHFNSFSSAKIGVTLCSRIVDTIVAYALKLYTGTLKGSPIHANRRWKGLVYLSMRFSVSRVSRTVKSRLRRQEEM